jgi:hypothetical protein
VEPATLDIKSYMITITHEPKEEKKAYLRPYLNKKKIDIAKIVSKSENRTAELEAKCRSST